MIFGFEDLAVAIMSFEFLCKFGTLLRRGVAQHVLVVVGMRRSGRLMGA